MGREDGKLSVKATPSVHAIAQADRLRNNSCCTTPRCMPMSTHEPMLLKGMRCSTHVHSKEWIAGRIHVRAQDCNSLLFVIPRLIHPRPCW